MQGESTTSEKAARRYPLDRPLPQGEAIVLSLPNSDSPFTFYREWRLSRLLDRLALWWLTIPERRSERMRAGMMADFRAATGLSDEEIIERAKAAVEANRA